MHGGTLVGRDSELEALAEALASVRAGRRALVMLSGEPGIGKTSLLDALASRVVEHGGVAAWGRTLEVGITPSFWPWIQMLHALESPGDPAPALGSLEQHTDASARLSLFGEVRSFLRRRAAASPVALLLDDLHAADPSSLQLLEYLVPELSGHAVLVALAARDSDANPQTAAALGRLQRGAARLPLSRLGAEDVRTLVAGRADAARVFELSEGNPLFVEELVASQRSTGGLSLPRLSSVRGVIRERVQGLPEATQNALHAAAIVGRDFSARIVAEMVGELEVEPLLQPAVQLGLLNMTSPDRFRFSHALVAEAITDELASPEQARLHLQAAQAIERQGASDAVGLAHHLLAAGHLASEAAVHAAERAARECMAQLAFEDAAVLLERGLGALALGAPQDRRRRVQLLSARAEALQLAGQHTLAAELCDEAAGVVRSLLVAAPEGALSRPDAEDSRLFARIAWIRGLEWSFGRTDPRLVALLREALALLGDNDRAWRAKLLSRLAAAEQPARDPQEPVARALEAVALAKELAPRDRLDVMYVATAALVEYVEPAFIDSIHQEVLTLARGQDRWITLHTLLRSSFVALEQLDRLGFDARVAAFAAEAEAAGLPQWTRYVPMLDAISAVLEGRFDDAERAADACEASSEGFQDTGVALTLAVHRAIVASVRTSPVPATVKAALAGYVPGRAATTAWLKSLSGEREGTRLALMEVGERIPNDPDLAVMVGAAVAFVGDPAMCKLSYAALAPRAGGIVLASMVGFCVMELYDRLLLTLAVGSGRFDRIELHAERALKLAAILGSPVWQARVEADLAEALGCRAAAGDSERAAQLWAHSLEAAERLGMPGLVERCRAGLVGAGPAAPLREKNVVTPRASGEGAVSFTRRGELWVVAGFGEEVHVKDSRGLQMIARLAQEAGSALHALDLAGAHETDAGDAGVVLDPKARAQYRARVAELMAERDDAEIAADRGRLERTNHEFEMLTAELERAFGLGGRERRVGAASERARSNVQRRIAHGLDQIRAASRPIGEHLTATIRTGTYCEYRPK